MVCGTGKDSWLAKLLDGSKQGATRHAPARWVVPGACCTGVQRCRLVQRLNWFIHELSALVWLRSQPTAYQPAYVWLLEDDAWFTGDLGAFFFGGSRGGSSRSFGRADFLGVDTVRLGQADTWVEPSFRSRFYAHGAAAYYGHQTNGPPS